MSSPKPDPSRRILLPVAVGVLTGLLQAACFPDPGAFFLAPLALVPLLWTLPRLGWRQSVAAGWISGAVSLAIIFHWIVPTAINLAQFPGWGAGLVLAAYAVVYGVNGVLLATAMKAILGLPLPGWGQALAVPASVVAVDVLGPHLFPFTLGNTYFRVPLLIQGADLTGIEGATFVTVSLSVAGVWLARDLRSRRRLSLAPVAVAAGLAAAWLAYGAVRLAEVREAEETAPRLHLLLVQPDIRPQERRNKDPAVKDALVDRMVGMTRDADREGVDAVVWPEGAFPFDWKPGPAPHGAPLTYGVRAAGKVQDLVREIGVPLVFGSITRPDSRGRNSMMLLGPDGRQEDRYDKRRLLAFGEYMPLSGVFPWLKGKVKGVGNLQEGEAFGAFRIGETVAAPSICYEAVHAGLTRDAVDAVDARWILNLTNDGWFGTSGAPAQHLMVQVPRAVEMRRPLVRATMTGISAVVRASGDLADETGIYERAVRKVDVPLAATGKTVFAVAGRWFAWTCVAATVLALLVAIARYRRGKKSRSTSTG